MIDKELFMQMYYEIESKISAVLKIRNAPEITPPGCSSFDRSRIEFDYVEIHYVVDSYYCGQSDSECISFRWDEINEPLSYFAEKFKKEHEEKMERERKKREK